MKPEWFDCYECWEKWNTLADHADYPIRKRENRDGKFIDHSACKHIGFRTPDERK
jgi:hypothetical protein